MNPCPHGSNPVANTIFIGSDRFLLCKAYFSKNFNFVVLTTYLLCIRTSDICTLSHLNWVNLEFR